MNLNGGENSNNLISAKKLTSQPSLEGPEFSAPLTEVRSHQQIWGLPPECKSNTVAWAAVDILLVVICRKYELGIKDTILDTVYLKKAQRDGKFVK